MLMNFITYPLCASNALIPQYTVLITEVLWHYSFLSFLIGTETFSNIKPFLGVKIQPIVFG